MDLIVDWLTTSGRSLSILDDPGSKVLLTFLDLDCKVPSRTHVASLVKELH